MVVWCLVARFPRFPEAMSEALSLEVAPSSELTADIRSAVENLKQGLDLEARVDIQFISHLVAGFREGIRPRAPAVFSLRFSGQSS